MKSFTEVEQKFSKPFAKLEKERVKSIYLTAFGWGIFMFFILAVTAVVILGFVKPTLFSITWTSIINWIIDILPDGFPPQIIIIGVFVILSYSTSILLRKSFTSEGNYNSKIQQLITQFITFTLPDFSFNKQLNHSVLKVQRFEYTGD